jgi:hypothetical protein
MVFVTFTMDGERGSMRLRLRQQPGVNDMDQAFRRRLWAAAVSDRGGQKPPGWKQALSGLRGRVRQHALGLLTDQRLFELVRLRWGGISVG